VAERETSDGRRLRRKQNREAALEALAELFEEGVYQPGASLIAERAGLSPRSLFRYFDDIDELSRAAIEHQLERARPLLELDIAPELPVADKIELFVEARARLHEASAPAARAARVTAHLRPHVAAQVKEARALLRRQVRETFGSELTGDRAALLPAIDALCSFETYELLRHDQGLPRTRAVAALSAALHALLGTDGGRR
jgi:TetR/AcrR family transcriptional regulator, regulator of autoinduction and epiphytic fitness